MFDGLMWRDVTKVFPASRTGIYDVTIAIPWSSIYVLIGANGAGKTTLLNLCLNHLRPDSGSITIGGTDVNEQPQIAKLRLAYVPELARLYNGLTALENIHFFGKLSGRRHSDDQIVSVLKRLHFSLPALRVATANFSKGMRQKVVIAIGLLKGADVFLLDEPTAGLDPASARALIGILQELKGEGKIVFAVSHDLQNLATASDRIGVLSEGRLTRDAPPSDFSSGFHQFLQEH